MDSRPAEESVSGAGRSLASPGRFADDDGSPDWAIRRASSPADLLAALRQGRVIVAVTAVATEVDDDGEDKESDMAIVSMVAPDGRRGLLAFSGLDALAAWDSHARPVPVSGVDAAAAALDDGCEALVIDVAGPRQLTVVESDLVDLAGRDRLQHACSLIARYLDEALGAGQSTVSLNSGVVRVECEAEAAHEVATDLGSAVRIHALVPGGVEIHPRGAKPVD